MKADGVRQWTNTAEAVPTKDTIVEEDAALTQELKDAVITLKANTRSSLVSLECTSPKRNLFLLSNIEENLSKKARTMNNNEYLCSRCRTTTINNPVADAEEGSNIADAEKASNMSPNKFTEMTKTPVPDLVILDIFKAALTLSKTELSVNDI